MVNDTITAVFNTSYVLLYSTYESSKCDAIFESRVAGKFERFSNNAISVILEL